MSKFPDQEHPALETYAKASVKGPDEAWRERALAAKAKEREENAERHKLQPGHHDTKALVTDRGKTHGDFVDHARITQKLKYVYLHELNNRIDRGQSTLSPTQMEGIEMILHKIGRIIAGDPNVHDHWDDIAGYATITRERIGK